MTNYNESLALGGELVTVATTASGDNIRLTREDEYFRRETIFLLSPREAQSLIKHLTAALAASEPPKLAPCRLPGADPAKLYPVVEALEGAK